MSSWILPDFNEFQIDIKSNEKKHKDNIKLEGNQKLWIDDYPPLVSDELAIHKKKILELKTWIEESIKGIKMKKFILLTGPPGSGKSTALKILCKEKNIDIREWVNKERMQKIFEEDLYIKQGEEFYSFLMKSSKYNNIFTMDENFTRRKSLILVEEFPFIFIKNPFEFFEILRNYNALSNNCPIVFIISDENDKSITRQLFPNHIQDELFITNIVFNSVATSILIQALNRIIQLRIKNNKLNIESPSKQFLQTIAERSGGDIRSAINILQISLTKGPSSNSIKGYKKGTSRKRLRETEGDIDFIGYKDAKLILFRALGKVLYCKRKIESDIRISALPNHLKNEERLPMEENPEDIFERSATDSSTFCLFLHHNCHNFFKDLSAMEKSLHYITDADILQSYWNPNISLDSYCSSLSIRGLMHCISNSSNHSTSGQSFRSLNKPYFFNYLQTSNDCLNKCKKYCQIFSCTDTELLTTIIPLTSKIMGRQANICEANKFIVDLGSMSNISRSISINSPEETNASISIRPDYSNLQTNEDDPEDFCIEEFSD